MIPEFGHFALILALSLSSLQFFIPIVWGFRQNRQNSWLAIVHPLALGQSFLIFLSFLCLVYVFVQDDFSVLYVANNSNSALPLIYKISAIWGGHAGSFLLWILLFAGWMSVFSFFSRHLPFLFTVRVLMVLGGISVGLLLFLLTTSNPFERFLPNYPLDGRDLNPLLQDPGLIIHPPLLYMGYVGFSIPFAFALSALLMRGEPLPFAKWMRPWVLSAWSFLTIGIALGSWWAYYELGWGGWWFWDPVENASFMPWLVGIALIHSLMVTDKCGVFQGWTVLLAIVTFALSLLGTFLVRSGVLNSVHAFANDPARGIFLLYFLFLVVGGAFLLYAFFGKKLVTETKVALVSRETLILLTALFLLVATMAILLGTLYPLIYDALTNQKISVGFPYFNAVFIPLIIPVLIFVPLGPFMKWGPNELLVLLKKIRWIFIVSIIAGIGLPWLMAQTLSQYVIIGLGLAIWIALGTLKKTFEKAKKRGGFSALTLGAFGMLFAHFGVAVMVVGITLVSNYHIEREVRLFPLQQLNIGDHQVQFQNVEKTEGSNYIGYQGHFVLFKEGKKKADLYPEKRLFVVQGSVMTETAIEANFFRDIYIALGERLDSGGWSVRIYYKPFVRWIWLGALMMALGGFLAALGRRHRASL